MPRTAIDTKLFTPIGPFSKVGAALALGSLLFAMSACAAAADDPDGNNTAAEPPPPSVAVTGTKDPDWKPYRKMLDGLNAFEAKHALAPQAVLKFVLRPQQPGVQMNDLHLHIVGDHTSIDVPISADYTFALPRDAAAAEDDADLRLSAKKGMFRWRPDIHTAGLPPGTRRLGDLRLECEVRWAVDKFDLSFLPLAYLTPLGGACHTSRSRIFYTAPAPITGATLVMGARRERLPLERLDQHDHTRYAPPLHDNSWPDDTLVELEFQVREPAPASVAVPVSSQQPIHNGS